MKTQTQLYRDVMMDGWGGQNPKKSDIQQNQQLLIDIMMKKYGITWPDMEDKNIIISKLRDANIKEILK